MDNNDSKDVKVKFYYINNEGLTTSHVDGVYGGLTSRGKLHLSFFVERKPLPEKELYGLTEKGTLDDSEVEKTVKDGIIREFQGSFIMDIDVAKSLKNWLDDKISMYEKLTSESDKKDKEKSNE